MSPQTLRVDRNELISYIRSYSSRVMPGLFNILNKTFITRHNSDIASLFLSDPKKVYETLLDLYGSEDTATLVMNYLLIKPMLIRLGRLDLTDKATMLVIKNPEEFKEMMRSIGADL